MSFRMLAVFLSIKSKSLRTKDVMNGEGHPTKKPCVLQRDLLSRRQITALRVLHSQHRALEGRSCCEAPRKTSTWTDVWRKGDTGQAVNIKRSLMPFIMLLLDL